MALYQRIMGPLGGGALMKGGVTEARALGFIALPHFLFFSISCMQMKVGSPQLPGPTAMPTYHACCVPCHSVHSFWNQEKK